MIDQRSAVQTRIRLSLGVQVGHKSEFLEHLQKRLRSNPGEQSFLELYLRRLVNGGIPLSAFQDEIALLGEEKSTTLEVVLSRASLAGALSYQITLGSGRSIATLFPNAQPVEYAFNIKDDAKLKLSRFAYLHSVGSSLVVETPLSSGRLVLDDCRAGAVLHFLTKETDYLELVIRTRLPELSLRALIDTLAEARFLEIEGDDATSMQDYWEFHDLLFHARTRLGRHSHATGASFRFRGKRMPEPPQRTPPHKGQHVFLKRRKLKKPTLNDLSFTQILEARSSAKSSGAQVLSKELLEEFLYCSVRAKDNIGRRDRHTEYQPSYRLYPTAGGAAELEVYLFIRQCTGLSPGAYYYDPFQHELIVLGASAIQCHDLLSAAAQSWDGGEQPSILFVISARFSRIMWKYESLSYSLILKDVGALLQTMYLVATSMKLRGCALGTGDSDKFCRATGLDYYAESAVGEFMLA